MKQEDYSIIRRFTDLSNQADRKGIVLFSDFLNLNEINLLQQCREELPTSCTLWGGYELAERQMVAFQPDALYYQWDYPISCIEFQVLNEKFAQKLSHRDVLGALMHLGIQRASLGDIVISDKSIYVFCQEKLMDYIIQEISQINRTKVVGRQCYPKQLENIISYREMRGNISSNRLDAFVAFACKLSRNKAAEYILGEHVFVDGKLITNHNFRLSEGNIISLRGYGKVRLKEIGEYTRKGRIWISLQWYT